jgi:hypothetical protein
VRLLQSLLHLSLADRPSYYINDDWKFNEILLGFEHLRGKHTGKSLAESIIAVLEDADIAADRIFTVTSDNASNNIAMMQHLQDAIDVLAMELGPARVTHIPCLAHVIQLALNTLVDSVKIAARNERLILEWNDDPSAHTHARRGEGIPWTLCKVSRIMRIVTAILTTA